MVPLRAIHIERPNDIEAACRRSTHDLKRRMHVHVWVKRPTGWRTFSLECRSTIGRAKRAHHSPARALMRRAPRSVKRNKRIVIGQMMDVTLTLCPRFNATMGIAHAIPQRTTQRTSCASVTSGISQRSIIPRMTLSGTTASRPRFCDHKISRDASTYTMVMCAW